MFTLLESCVFKVGSGRVIINVDLSLGYLPMERERLLCWGDEPFTGHATFPHMCW